MGRKEGGSLFHQFINTPGLFILSDRTHADGSPMEVSYKTRENYYDWLHRAAEYFKGRGVRSRSEIDAEKIQEYENYLKTENLSASTIHSYLAPVCKMAAVKMSEVEKPIRRASEFTRSSKSEATDGGKPGELNAMLGLREGGLHRLHGNDLIEKDGVTYVVIDRDKGGKYHEQKVLPEYDAAVRGYFDGSSRRLFHPDEFKRHFDYHRQRREVAVKAYKYYRERMDNEPGYRRTLYKELAGQWHDNNKKHRDKLEPLSFFDKPYRLRGANRELARSHGKPEVLDRLILRAVSIQHLAHWRDKVTVQSYFFGR